MLIAGGKLTLYSHICNEWINYYTSRTCFFLKVTIGTDYIISLMKIFWNKVDK